MVDQDVSQTIDNAQTAPPQAVKNIVEASNQEINPDSYAQGGGVNDPSKAVPTTVDRNLASIMNESSQVTSALKPDVDKMDYVSKMGSYAGLSIKQTRTEQEYSELANKIRTMRNEGKQPSQDDLDSLALAREDAQSVSADMEKLNLGEVSKAIGSIPNMAYDMLQSAGRHWAIVGAGTATGAALGAGEGTVIPVIGNFVGIVGGGATGAVLSSLVANSIDNANRAIGRTYDELDNATDANGRPVKLPQDLKNNIAIGTGLLTGSIDFGANLIGAHNIPVLRRILSPEWIRGAVADTGKRAILEALSDYVKHTAATSISQGISQGSQDFVKQFAGDLGKTWDGKETSLASALNAINLSQSAEAAGKGLVQGAAIAGAMGLIPAGRRATKGATPEKAAVAGEPPTSPTPAASAETGSIPVQQPKNDFIQVQDGVPTNLSPHQSLNFAVALKAIAEQTDQTKLGAQAPVDMAKIQERLLNEAGVNKAWVSADDLSKWADSQEKADAVFRRFTPSQIEDLQSGGRVAVDPATILDMIRQDPKAANIVRPSADGMSVNEIINAYKDADAKAQEYFKSQGTGQATDRAKVTAEGEPVALPGAPAGEGVDTTRLGPQSTPEEIAATLQNKQEANAYLSRLDAEEASIRQEPEPAPALLEAIQKTRENIKAVHETLPDQERVAAANGDLSEQEIADAAYKAYMSEPITTDLVRAGVNPKAIAEIESRYREIRSRIVEATQEAAEKEMGQVRDQVAALSQYETELEAHVQAMNDPAIHVVETFKNNRDHLSVDPRSLTVEQRIKYAEDAVLEERGVFKKNGMDPDSLAMRLGVEDGDKVLEILSKTPDLEKATKNAIEDSKKFSLESADNIEIQSASILKVITDKQKMNLKEFNELVNSSWAKTRNGVEKTIFAKIDLEQIREQAQTKVQQTRLSQLSPKAYEMQSKLAATRKVKAALRGDLLEAARQREIEIRSDEMLKQTYATIGQANKATKQINTMMRNPEILQSLDDAGMTDAFADLSNIVNLGDNRRAADVGAFQRLQKKLESEQLTDITIPQELIASFDPRAKLNDLSYEQVDFIRKKMKEMVGLANEKNIFTQGQEKIALQTAADAVIPEIKQAPGYREGRPIKKASDITLADKAIAKLRMVDDSMSNIQYIVSEITQGDSTKALHQMVVHQIFGTGIYEKSGYGLNAQFKMIQKLQDRIKEKFEAAGGKRIEKYAQEFVDAPELVGSENLLDKNGQISKRDLMGYMLYYGSETGRQRLGNYKIDPDVVKTFAEKHLTDADMQFVQDIHDTFDLTRPDIDRVKKEMGHDPVEYVEGSAYDFNGKKIRGGYFTLRYLEDITPDLLKNREKELTNQAIGESKSSPMDITNLDAMTKQGQYITRVTEFAGVPDLDFGSTLTMGLENIATDVAMAVPIKNIMKLLGDGEVATNMRNAVGDSKFQVLKNHVLSAGKSLQTHNLELFKELQSSWDKTFSYLGNNVVSSSILFNMKSLFMQANSGFLMWHSQGLRSTGSWMGTVSKMMTRPDHAKAVLEFAATIDPSIGQYVSNAGETMRGLKYDLPRDKSKNAVLRTVGEYSRKASEFFFNKGMETVDVYGKAAASLTAYNRFLSGKVKGMPLEKLMSMSETERIQLAKGYAFDQINRTGTAGTILDKSQSQKSKGLIGGLSRWFNDVRNTYNYLMWQGGRPALRAPGEIIGAVKSGDYTKAAGKMFDVGYSLATLHMMTAAMATLQDFVRGTNASQSVIAGALGLTADDDSKEYFSTATSFTAPWFVEKLENVINNFTSPTSSLQAIAGNTLLVKDAGYQIARSEQSPNRGSQINVVELDAINRATDGVSSLHQMALDQEMSDKQMASLVTAAGVLVPNVPAGTLSKIIMDNENDLPIGQRIVHALTTGFGLVGGGVMLAKGVMDKALERGDHDEYNTAKTIRDEMVDPNRTEIVKGLQTGKVRALTPNEIEVIGFAEGGGKMSAKATTTSAAGIYQFTSGTWSTLMNKYPELGLTTQGRITSAKQQQVAMERLVRDNAISLAQNKIDISLETVYAAHHFNPSVVKAVWSKEDYAKIDIKKIVGSGPYNSNAWLRGGVSWINDGKPIKTVADFKRGINDLLDNGRMKQDEDFAEAYRTANP